MRIAAAALGAALVMGIASPSFAQAPAECAAIGPMLKQRGELLQRVQAFHKKKPTAVEACSVFSNLAANGSKVMPWLKANQDWCHVPPEVAQNIGAQEAAVNKAKANACQAAATQKKMEAQAKKGGGQAPGLFGGGDDVVGGPIKMPQGAL